MRNAVAWLGLVLCACGGEDMPAAGEGISDDTLRAENQLAVGAGFGCLHRNDGTWCWGDGDIARKDLTAARAETPILVTDPPDILQLSAGLNFVCTRREKNGWVYCWALEYFAYQAGLEVEQGHVRGLEPIATMDSAYAHSCGVTNTGRVQCWGSNLGGAVGDPAPFESVYTIPDIDTATSVAVAPYRNCALLVDKTARCWGGRGDAEVDVSGWRNVHRLFPSTDAVCARFEDGTFECNGSANWFHAAKPNIVDLADAYGKACYATRSGEVACWGTFGYGPNALEMSTPLPIPVPGKAIQVTVSGSAACALTQDLRVFCWGFEVDESTRQPLPEVLEITGFE